MFIPLGVGVLGGAACSPFVNKHYLSLCRKHGGHPPAEARLIPMMLSCWLIPIGLFIFAWTSYPQLSWVGPALGGLPVGFGFIFLYNSANNYIGVSSRHTSIPAISHQTKTSQLIPTNTKPRPLWRRKLSFAPFGVLRLCFLRRKCTRG